MHLAKSRRSDHRSPFWGEQRSRYHFAAKYVRGRFVVDLAELAAHTRIYPDAGATGAAALVRSRPKGLLDRSDLSVVICDHKRFPLLDSSCDFVSCLGSLQHGGQVPARARELRRILRPGGIAVLSIPNALYVPWVRDRRRDSGFGETTPGLRSSLLRYFEHVEVFGQRVHPRYTFAPFWESRDTVQAHSRPRLRAMTWIVRHSLPFSIKDGMERLTHNRAFYPGEYDFQFIEGEVGDVHDLVAVCRT